MTSGTEEEQLAQIKDWWQRNGKPLVLGAVIALVLVFGWQFWQKHQINQAQERLGGFISNCSAPPWNPARLMPPKCRGWAIC